MLYGKIAQTFVESVRKLLLLNTEMENITKFKKNQEIFQTNCS